MNSIAKAIESVLQIAEEFKDDVKEIKSNFEELKNDVEVSNFVTKSLFFFISKQSTNVKFTNTIFQATSKFSKLETEESSLDSHALREVEEVELREEDEELELSLVREDQNKASRI